MANEEYKAVNKYLNTYTTFSGADIVATFGGVEIGALSGITFSVTREKAPIYTMGSPNPRSFSRGKRGIAGSLIFTVFDRPALYTMLDQNRDKAIEQQFYTRSHNVLPNSELNGGQNHGITGVGSGFSGDSIGVKKVTPYYADQIPPFDITITFANEYGQSAVRSIYGVELLNEGSGASMDDIVIEETMTYVARELGPMYRIDTDNDLIGDQDTNSFLQSLLNKKVNTTGTDS
jgi:hypothetical protein